MKEIIEILEKLRVLSGNEQLDYLKSHSDNTVLREVLWYTYNPDLKYNIKEAKLNGMSLKMIALNVQKRELDINIWNSYKSLLTELASKKSSTELDVARVFGSYFLDIDEKGQELLRGVLLKDLKINMGVTTFNKIWNDFYFKYPYMGAKPFSMANVQKVKMPCYGQLKADGLFCNAIVDPINKTVEYISRQGKPINIYGSLEDSLLKIKTKYKFVLHGELLCIDKQTNKPLSREISNGIIRRDVKNQEELNSIIMLAWDFVPYEDFVKGIWNVPYSKRFEVLKQMATYYTGDRLRAIDTYEIDNIDEAMQLFNKLYSQGEEGIILKEKDIIWKDGKPKGCVKIKAELECDLRAVEFKEGSGAYENMCGTIVCVSEDDKLKVGVKPRTPLQAQEIWNNQDKYLNQILSVKYNARIKRKDEEVESLFLPVFIEWRINDKDVADNLEQIK